MIRRVSSLLLNPTDKLKVQLSVGLIDAQNNPSYCDLYNMDNASYLNISPHTSVSIRYIEKGKPWNRYDSIHITPRNIYTLKTDLTIFYNTLLDKSEKLYSYGSDGYIKSMGDIEQFKRTIVLGNNQILSLEPATIYDTIGKPIPGIYMFINTKSNMVELSLEEFESFYHLFMNINIHQEGMLLLQTYIIMCLKSGGLKIPVDKTNNTSYNTSEKDVGINIFERADYQRNKELVSGPPISKKENFTLEDLE